MINRRNTFWLLGGTTTVAAFDLGTKVWANRALQTKAIVLPGPIDLRLSHNRGVAFGSFDRLPVGIMLAVTAAVTVVVVLAGLRGSLPALPAALVAGGALGNVIDRVEGGSVVDMLHTGWWPTFNLADVFICIGVALLALSALREPSSVPVDEKRPAEDAQL